MKSKSQKYEEAVVRNITEHERYAAWTTAWRRELSRDQIKRKLGIKQSDTRFDHLPCLNLRGQAEPVE